MNPFFLNTFSSFPLVEGDQDQGHFYPFAPSTNDLFPYTFIFNNPSDQRAFNCHPDHHHHHQEPQKFNVNSLVGGSYEQLISFPSYNYHNNFDCINIEQSLRDQQVRKDDQLHEPTNWIPAKVRSMREPMEIDRNVRAKPRSTIQVNQDQSYSNQESSSSNNSNNESNCCNSSNGVIRMCSDCNTTKTPLWRSGPRGPKSLCNACGIRQRKARRATAAAAEAAASGGLISAETASKARKKKTSDVDRTVPFKKRYKFTACASTSTPKKLCFDDIVISLGKNLASDQVFPQDEKDAAILLMALSCG